MSGRPKVNSTAQTSLDDRQCTLLTAVAEHRDTDAFAELFRFFAPRVAAMISRRGGDNHTAREIAQDALLQVWRRAAQFDSNRGQVSTWVYTIARNAFIDRIRKERHFDYDPQADVAARDLELDKHVAHIHSAEKLLSAIKKLPPEQLAVIATSYGDGQSLSEIAKKWNLPVGTVKTRARLALKKLRELLSEPSEES